MTERPDLHHLKEGAGDVITPGGILAGTVQGCEVNGADFNLRFPIFPARMTLFHEKMTPLFEGMPILVPD
jgi:hypothetical protein